jgi:hypothetical protein
MAIIYTYPAIGTPEDPDIMLISDVSLASNATRNITLSNLAAFINAKVNLSTAGDTGNGTVNLSTEILSVIGTANQIETEATDQTIQIGLPSTLIVPGTMNVVGTANFDSNVTMDIGLTVDDFLIADGDVRLLGPTPFSSKELVINGTTALKGDTRFFGKLLDTDQGVPGSDGSILTSTGTGVAWKASGNIPGNASGTGTNLTAPMWYGSTPTSNLADSSLSFTIVDPGNLNDYGMQFGGLSSATGQRNSIAMGYSNQATAEATLATGHDTRASGMHSASFNYLTQASGDKSAAFGSSTQATGNNCFAIGQSTTAATSLAFAGGLNSTANPSLNGATAFAYGDAVNAFGPNSAVFGKQNSAQGENSFVAGGAGCIASGKNSLVIGNLSSAVQEKAIAIGEKNKAWAFGSIVIGTDSIAVSGKNNSIVLGMDLSASTDKQVVLGRNNKLTGASKFVVGNGIDTNNRKNGLEITGSHVAIPDYGSGAVTGTATYNLSVDALGKIVETAIPAAPSYTSFICLLSQSGGANPQVNNILENSLGITLPASFTRVSGGEYNLSAPGKFKLLKTIVFINGGSAENNHDVAWEVIDSDNLRIRTHNSDSKLTKASLEIRTYN